MKRKFYFFLPIVLVAIFSACQNNQTETSVRLMSFNLRNANAADGDNAWCYRREACAKMLQATQPDVLGVQEALPNMVKYLEQTMPDYACVAVGRDPEAKSNEASAIFYNTKRFSLIRSNSFWLSETPDSCSLGWDAKYKRIATYVYLHDMQSGKQLVVLNTHLDHRGVMAQQMGLKLVTDTLLSLKECGAAVFAMGDFNVLPNDSVLRPIRACMQSAQETAQVTDGRPTCQGFGHSEDGEKVIDYIFYSGAVVESFRILTDDYGVLYLSDHYPIEGTFVL